MTKEQQEVEFKMSEEDLNWEVLALPPELEISAKNKQPATGKAQETNAKDVGLDAYENPLI